MKNKIKKINQLNNKLLKKDKFMILCLKYKQFKIIIFLLPLIIIIRNKNIILKYKLDINEKYIKIQKNINITFKNKIKNKINIGIYGYCIKNGGRARITAFLLNYFYKIKIFNVFLFTRIDKENNEYFIPHDIKRIVIKNNLMKIIRKNKIDILIYELYNIKEIESLTKVNDLKVIFYLHSSIFDWIYENYTNFKYIYKAYSNSKYCVSIVHLENDYLFGKWGIKSILVNNFMTYQYNSIIPSELSSNIILMFGRGNAIKKRFELGIQAMEYIISIFYNCELKIISSLIGINHLENLINNLDIDKNVKLIGYSSIPEIYFKNASLNFFPSISESFGLVLSEAKIYGVPNILLGLDYISIANGGTIIIYDDSPESLAKESIKILENNKYKKVLGIEAKLSMKNFDNELLFVKWVKLLLSIYNDNTDNTDNSGNYYEKIRQEGKKISTNDSLKIIKNQLKLLKKRDRRFTNLSLNNFENFTFLENIN